MRVNRLINICWAAIVVLVASTATALAKPPARAEVVDSAINLTALQPGQQGVAAVVIDVKPGFHAQSHKPLQDNLIAFEATAADSPAISFLSPVYPAGEVVDYPNLGKLSVYTGKTTIYVPFEVKDSAAIGDNKIALSFNMQLCDENVCYAPIDLKVVIAAPIVARGQKIGPNRAELFKDFDPTVFAKRGATTQAARDDSSGNGTTKLLGNFSLGQSSYGLAFAAAFIVGILFNVMPCVLPVLPLKAIGFYEVSQHNRAKCIAFGSVFSAGVIASFGVLALLVVVLRVLDWGQLYTNVWFTLIIVGILLAMAISTFGFFTVNLPPAIYSVTPRHDTYLGNFLFGILTAILSTPCTFGMFLGLLVWATAQPAWIGVSLLMFVGCGMALPYFLLSAFPEIARRFPRTGPWSELVKQMMAFLLLGAAVFFARRFIQPLSGSDGFWWVLFAVVVIAGAYLVGRTLQLTPRAMPRAVAVAVAVLVLILPGLIAVRYLVAQPYSWTPYSDLALKEAHARGKVAVVEFTAAWCSNCQVLETFVLHDKSVVDAVKKNDVVMLKADLTRSNAPGWPLLRSLNPIAGIPFTAVYSSTSDDPTRLTGIYSSSDLRQAMQQAAQGKSSVALATH